MSTQKQYGKYANQIETYFTKKFGFHVVQLPNAPIILFLIALPIFYMLPQDSFIARITAFLAFGGIFTWAWLEIFYGLDIFRRILGTVVMVVILWYAAGQVHIG